MCVCVCVCVCSVQHMCACIQCAARVFMCAVCSMCVQFVHMCTVHACAVCSVCVHVCSMCVRVYSVQFVCMCTVHACAVCACVHTCAPHTTEHGCLSQCGCRKQHCEMQKHLSGWSSRGRARGGSRAPSHMVLGSRRPPRGRDGAGAREAAAPAGVRLPSLRKK